jgi:nicotinamide mononucleotide adenylyltransferase
VPQYVPTAKVLRHFDHEINTVLGGIEGADGQMRKARIALLAGADLVMSMGMSSGLSRMGQRLIKTR